MPDVLHAHTVQVSLVPNLDSKREELDPTISKISLVQVGSENELSSFSQKSTFTFSVRSSSLLLHGFCCLDMPRTSARDIWTVSPVHAETQCLSQTSGPLLPCMTLCALLISVLFSTVKNGNAPF